MSVISEHLYKGVVVQGAQNAGTGPEAKLRVQDAILERVADLAGVVIPEETVLTEAERLRQVYLSRAKYENLSSGKYLEVLMDMQQSPEEYAQMFRRDALKELELQEVIRAIIEAEGLQVTHGELEEEARALARRQGMTLEAVKGLLGEDLTMLKQDILEQKVRTLVYESAAFS